MIKNKHRRTTRVNIIIQFTMINIYFPAKQNSKTYQYRKIQWAIMLCTVRLKISLLNEQNRLFITINSREIRSNPRTTNRS